MKTNNFNEFNTILRYNVELIYLEKNFMDAFSIKLVSQFRFGFICDSPMTYNCKSNLSLQMQI